MLEKLQKIGSRRHFVLLILLVIPAAPVMGQSMPESKGSSLRPDVAFADHLERKFHVREGLPSGFIYDAIQTRDGYLWIATHNGIARYDGFQFKIFNRANTPQLPSNDTRVLFEDQQGVLWIGTTGGLVRFQRGRPGSFKKIDEFTGNSILAFFEDKSGNLWIGTREKTWIKSDREVFTMVENAPSAVLAICEDRQGQIWFGARSGLYVQDHQSIRRLEHQRLPTPTDRDNGVPQAGVNELLVDDVGGIWVGANLGLLYIKDGRFKNRGQEIGRQRVADILLTRNGGTYVAARNGVYRSVENGPFEKLPVDESANCLMEDDEGGLWIGYAGNRGLRQFCNSLTQTVLAEKTVHCVFEDAKGNIWFGTSDGLDCLSDGKITHFGANDGLPSTHVSTIASGDENELWIGTRCGFAKWTGTEISTISSPPELTQMNIATAIVDSSGTLWFALMNGDGYCLNQARLTKLDELDHGHVKWFLEQENGAIWIGHEFGLYKAIDHQIQQISDLAFDELNGSHFTCRFLEPDGTLWLGTSTGIARYRSGRFEVFSSAAGLAADYLDRLATDSQGNLWCGGRDGYFFVSTSELDEFSAGHLTQVTSRRVEKLEGVPVSSRGPKAWLASDGTMWMVGRHGVFKVAADPPVTNPVPPKTHIERVTFDRDVVEAGQAFEFLSGRHRLSFDFTATSFSDPAHIRIKYKLDGYDSDWNEVTTERTAHYTDLGPGNYSFRVTAMNNDGIAFAGDETIGFTIQPRWWEKTWVRSASLVGIIGLLALSVMLYTHRIRKRNATLKKEIDERKLAETKLTVSEKRFRDLAKSTQAIPWEADAATFQFAFVGRQAVDVLGYPVTDWLDEEFWIEHLHPDDRFDAVEYWQRAVNRNESHQFEYRMIAADGRAVWLHNLMNVVKLDGAAKKIRGFFIDVTARRAAEEKSREYLWQLERVNRAASLGEMTTSIAHEVNQPLFAIVSNAETAKRLLNQHVPDVDEVREALNDIVEDGNRASAIIKNVRSLVRKEKQPTEQLDLSQVAREALQLIEPDIRRRGIVLRANLGENLPPIQGNSIELQQVILNFVLNGAQAIQIDDDEGELIVTTFLNDGAVELAVKDRGIGMDDENADRLFEPFFTTKPMGIGMGLAINKTIIEAHRGRIWATPNEGKGATFHFSLPTVSEVVA